MKLPSRLFLITMALALPASVFAQSGSWYNPVQSGHGLAVDRLSEQHALLLWFTRDIAGRPTPLYAEAVLRDGEFTGAAYAPFGPRFADWDPADLHFEPWGTLGFRPESCDRGVLRWASNELGNGSTAMQLLAYTAGTACPHVALPATRLGGLSGTWYHPQLQGASVNVQVVDDGGALAYWYTYDDAGRPKPLYVHGRFTGQTLQGEALAPHGQRFGSFRREDLVVEPFGDIELAFHDCGHATLVYDTPLGTGSLPLVRLTDLHGVECTLPDALPPGLPRHFTGEHLSLTPLPISAMLTARDEVLLHMDNRVYRGFFRRDARGRPEILFDDRRVTWALRYDAAGGTLEGYLDGFSFRDFRLDALPAERVVTSGLTQALLGTWGNFQDSPISNAGADFRVFADGTVALRLDSTARADGRIARVDEAGGTFDFDLRFRPFYSSTDNHRIMGSGRILVRNDPDGSPRRWIELFGSGPAGKSFYRAFPRVFAY